MLRETRGAVAHIRGAPITHEHDEHPPSGDEELHGQSDEQSGSSGQSTPGAVQEIPNDEFALVDAYGCLPPVARWLEAWEAEPVECFACGKVYFGSLYDLLDAHSEKSPDRPKSHDCEPHAKRRVLQYVTLFIEGPIRWDLMADREQMVTWLCMVCDELFDASLRAILHGEAHEYCWGWWARHRVHGRVVRSGGWRARHRREGCGYAGRGGRRLGAMRLPREGGCT